MARRSNRQLVYDAVCALAPCKSEEVIVHLDGQLTSDQIYSCLSHMKGGYGGSAPRIRRTAHGYYEPIRADDEVPDPDDSAETYTLEAYRGAAPDASEESIPILRGAPRNVQPPGSDDGELGWPQELAFIDESAPISEDSITSLLEELDAIDARHLAELPIQNAAEKAATCELLARMLAPRLADRMRAIARDIRRIANV